jgi:hypothetical protein
LEEAPPARGDFAFPGLTSTFRWMSAFLDASGISLTEVARSQPESGAMLMADAIVNTDINRASAGFRCSMVGVFLKQERGAKSQGAVQRRIVRSSPGQFSRAVDATAIPRGSQIRRNGSISASSAAIAWPTGRVPRVSLQGQSAQSSEGY